MKGSNKTLKKNIFYSIGMEFENFQPESVKNQKILDTEVKQCKVDGDPIMFAKSRFLDKSLNNLCVNQILLLDHEYNEDYSIEDKNDQAMVISYKKMANFISDVNNKIKTMSGEIDRLKKRVDELEDCVEEGCEDVIEI